MASTSDSEQLQREGILQDCREYFASVKKRAPAFVPGQTYIPVTAKSVDEDDLAALVDASLDMWLTTGRYATEFEKILPAHFGSTTSALLVNSGSSANLCAVSSLGSPLLEKIKKRPLRSGDEVITAAAGFPTTVNPILQNGWTPVFVDVDYSTLNARVEDVLNAVTPKTRAIVLAHSLGNPYRADQLAEFCREKEIFLIEDCCDALGGAIGAKPVGSFGDYSTVSFYPAHHITMGEGGAVMSRGGGLRRVAESIRDWGRDCWCEPGKDNTCGKRFSWQLGDLPCGYDHKYTYSSIGYNLKATDMQAAVGVSQLKKLPGFVAARRANWKRMFDGINSSPVLKNKFVPVVATQGTDPSWFGFPLHCAEGVDRQRVVTYLEDHRVGTRLMFAGNLTKQPAYQGQSFRISGSLQATDRIMSQTFWLGVHPALDDRRIDYVLETLEAVAKTI